MWVRLKQDPMAIGCLGILLLILMAGVFAPYVAPHHPDEVNISLKYAAATGQYPLGNDYLGRCILSRLIYGIRPSVILVAVSMLCTIGFGTIIGIVTGYFKGKVDEFFMRLCDIMLSFPTEVMILAVVGIFGVGLKNILLAIVFLGWPWYARVFRTAVMKYTDKNFIQFAKASGSGTLHIVFKHLLPSVLPEIAAVTSNRICFLILSISGYSFLGLGVQPPTAEWGMMLNEGNKIMLLHPEQMLAPGVAIIIVCVAFAFLGDSLRDAMDAKHESHLSRRKRLSKRSRKGVGA